MVLKSKKVKTFLLILISLILLAIGMEISLYIGTKAIDFSTIIRSIFTNDNTLESNIIRDVRIPRVLAAVMVGGFL